MKNRTVPVFVVHRGCPHRCVFCDQRSITGSDFDLNAVPDRLEEAFSRPANRGAQIAFFGGSFTAIPQRDMLFMLDCAQSFVDRGLASGIRFSTRPDAVDGAVMDLLKPYTLTAVELGIQSMSDAVLQKCERGHTAEDSRLAARAVIRSGRELVGQMMLGLPGSSAEDEINTARGIADMGARAARVYPTAVFRGTVLEKMALSGEYAPLEHADALERAKAVCRVFTDAGVKLIRVGLCESDGLRTDAMSGETSPSFGEEVYSALWLDRETALLDPLRGSLSGAPLELRCPPGAESRAAGYRGANKKELIARYGLKYLRITADPSLTGDTVRARIL